MNTGHTQRVMQDSVKGQGRAEGEGARLPVEEKLDKWRG